MHAVQCGEEGQILSDFCFVGELRVDVLVGGEAERARDNPQSEFTRSSFAHLIHLLLNSSLIDPKR